MSSGQHAAPGQREEADAGVQVATPPALGGAGRALRPALGLRPAAAAGNPAVRDRRWPYQPDRRVRPGAAGAGGAAALAAAADRITLIRRLSFDLARPAADACRGERLPRRPRTGRLRAALVDRFLASPHYGERMAPPVAGHRPVTPTRTATTLRLLSGLWKETGNRLKSRVRLSVDRVSGCNAPSGKALGQVAELSDRCRPVLRRNHFLILDARSSAG